jgi:hypothetical protein
MEYTFYKLSIGDKCYVGSTKDLYNRMKLHKYACYTEKCKEYNKPLYKVIREKKWEDIEVMIIDKIIYNHKREAEEMETKFMLNFNAELNVRYPKRNNHEYYEANKDKWVEYEKNNKEKINQQRGVKKPCDICGKMMRRDSISRHKKSQH